tara:strand:- start:1729 stop:6270 length:4542 start_codon:yes stop_codon:yes gene_type:complete
MANITRNFIKGRMNKSVDERLIPDGEYIDAINVRMGSTEGSEIGVIENTKGNVLLTTLQYNNYPLSTQAKCIGAYEDGANEKIYWFVHDPYFTKDSGGIPAPEYPTGILDLIVSYDTKDGIIDYHVISVNDGGGIKTTLNFDPQYLITGVDLVENLLFFTDNKNAPRFININSGYDNPALNASFKMVDYGDDSATLSERLLVIKRPPLYAPTLNFLNIPIKEDNYLEDRYISFAYRYRYSDGEYSATSPFSNPAFIPKLFNFSQNSLLNEGMINSFNSVNVSYDTGGPLVESIELLFKEAQNSIIKVIDKFNKTDQGFANNTNETYTFTNSNIFTILPDSEILRLYDNVPRFALGQTMMGNRLIYGNYIDGYNLERNGVPTQIEYTVDLVSESNSSDALIGGVLSGTYNIPTRGINVTCNNTALINLSSIKNKLKKGSVLTFDFSFEHNSFAGPNTPTLDTPLTNIDISFTIPRDYTSVYDLVTSVEFINAIGNSSPKNINPVYAPTGNRSCDGVTLTDEFNCLIPQQLTTGTGSVEKFSSATSGASLVGLTEYNNNEVLGVGGFPSGPSENIIVFIIPYMRFVADVNQGASTTNDVYEFYDFIEAQASLQSTNTLGSLHSNRGYEIGMAYMDDFGRSSTALVSNNNSLQVPCSASKDKNTINVTIPTRQIAPEWATHYKFVIKPDEENYDVIYSNVYYQENEDANYYFLLEGENSQKIEEGDRLIVKADSSGPRSGCVYATVLEKVTFASDGIQEGSFAGTYMKINPNTINATEDVNAFFPMNAYVEANRKDDCPSKLFLLEDRTQQYGPISIPAGSVFTIETLDATTNVDATCINCPEREVFVSNIRIVANRNYTDLKQWLDAVNFNTILQENNSGPSKIQWSSNLITPGCTYDFASIWWVQGNGTSTADAIVVQGFPARGRNSKRRSRLDIRMSLRRTESTVIFETEPQDALPDVWFESADTYTINSLGEHSGSEQDQVFSTNTPAIVNTDFYNCFSFGNGAESYKIRDSIIGKTFNLGNRVYTTNEQEYKEAHRFADLTYSGVYNEENNLNKLNEFNLGLLNFKPLERSFGPIQKLFGRETDILTLQEDKISYVLQGKEMITGSTGGSSLITVPEVLGKQVARIEEYGISNNPESFVQWGADKYFTDAKRGAVIQLKGTAGQNEKLTVISEQGMRTWFRDLFIDSFETQKLGGFDPYMDEYVLSSNNVPKPIDEDCIDCGVTLGQIIVDEFTPYEFCVDVGDLVGDVTINIEIDPLVSGEQFDIVYTYAGVTNTYSSLATPVNDTIVINKNSVSDQKVSLVVENSSPNKSYIGAITVGCPVADIITIVPISITSNANSGEYIHSEYSWTDGSFVSPLHSRIVTFGSDDTTPFIVSDYSGIQGPQGAGVIPADGATVSVICDKRNFDDFVFNEGTLTPLPPTPNNFRYLRSDTLYDNTVADIKLLLAETLTNPNGGVPAPIDSTNAPNTYLSTFTMPTTGSYLYLIWDYRLSTEDDLCFGATIEDSCCNC